MIWEKVIVDGEVFYKNDLKYLRYFDYVDRCGIKYHFEVNMRTQITNIRWGRTDIYTRFDLLAEDQEGCMGFYDKKLARFIFWVRIMLEMKFILNPVNWKHRNHLRIFRFFNKK